MASPPHPSHQPCGNSSDYFYFVVAVAAVTVLLLLLTNMIAVGCCSRWGIIEAVRRFLRSRRLLASAGEIDDKNIPEQLIPVCKYRREEAREHECSVCLSAFVEGEDIRQLPKCKHSFHAPCIDMWLYSHSNCPLCRADVLEQPPPRCEAFAGDDVGEVSMQRRPMEPRGSMGALVVALM